MRYMVYTDGAGSNDRNVIGCSYIILTDDNYINSGSIKLNGMSNPTHAETISVGLAAAYFIDNEELSPDDIIEFNIDCASTIDFYNTYLDNEDTVRTNVPAIFNSVRVVRTLRNKCKVRFQKVRGHKNVINPNTYVDRLAKLAIRR
jgi:hypothetical protein